MKVCYLLNGTAISGGVKVAMEHVWLLNRFTDIKAIAISSQEYPSWFEKDVPFKKVSDFYSQDLTNEYDIIVATYFDQLEPLYSICPERLLHFCQGYEGDYPRLVENAILGDKSPEEWEVIIESAYSIPIPRFTVSSWLTRYLEERFGDINITLGQGIDLDVFSPPASRPFELKRVLIAGDSRLAFKGVKTALSAAEMIRKKIKDVWIVRVNPVDNLSEESRWGKIDEYHFALSPSRMAELYKRCHLLIFVPEREGFGLPALEAMACGTPVVVSNIPPLRELVLNGEAGSLIERDPEAIAKKAVLLLGDSAIWSLMSMRGGLRAMDYDFLRLSKKLELLFKKFAKGGLRNG